MRRQLTQATSKVVRQQLMPYKHVSAIEHPKLGQADVCHTLIRSLRFAAALRAIHAPIELPTITWPPGAAT